MVKEYTCINCGFSTRCEDELRMHMKNVHEQKFCGSENTLPNKKESASTPPECNPDTDGTLEEHLEGPGLSFPQQCQFCQKKFDTIDKMVKHVLEDHNDIIGQMMGIPTPGGEMPSLPPGIMGDIGKMAGAILSQLGPMMGGAMGKKGMGGMFSLDNVDMDGGNDDDDDDGEGSFLHEDTGTFPDLSDIMKVGIQIGVVDGSFPDGEVSEDEFAVSEDEQLDASDSSSSLEKCPGCDNYVSSGTRVCPFCDRDIM